MPAKSPIDDLASTLGCDWENIRDARRLSIETRENLNDSLGSLELDQAVSLVACGSLARDEFTAGSDIDWTLMIDGPSNPEHYGLTRDIQSAVNKVSGKTIGPEGTFGAMAFSHNLVHDIGGQEDTNRNTTRRVLLMLESRAIGPDDAYRRVVRNILTRYVDEDRGSETTPRRRVPRFLLNDFARYWRTVAVDFAHKRRDRSGQGWAIRNIKLRMSRKLIYVSGLLVCFGRHPDDPSPDDTDKVVERLAEEFTHTPLEILARSLAEHSHLKKAARKILDSYDEFLAILADEDDRDSLEKMTENDTENKVYQRARDLSHQFRDGLIEFFFDEKSGMDNLTKEYGVF